MNRVASVLLVLCAACGGKKSENKTEAAKPTTTDTAGSATQPAAAATGCPMPAKEGVSDRFPVGTVPDYRVSSMAEAPKCHDEFVASDVVKLEGGKPKLVAEGTFQGHCPGEPDNKRTFEAVKPDKAVIEVNATHTDLGGELGLGKPVMLDSKQPDKLAGVIARVVDRCGTPLTLGVPGNITTWTAGAGCDKVAKVVAYDVTKSADRDKSQEMQIAPIGPGTCTVTAELLGVKGDVTVTVK